MKTRWIHITAGLTMFVLCISIFTTTTSATIFWSEDFESGLGDWTIFGFENESSQVKIEGNFSAASGRLTVLDDGFNVASHNSTMTVGSWIFDMFVPEDDEGWFYVKFMSNGTRPVPAFASTFVCIGAYMTENDFPVWQSVGTHIHLHTDIYMDSIQGLHHIKVNRTSGGHFEVYINRTLRGFFDNNDVTSSTYFEVACRNATGAYVDNIVVSDDLSYETPTTPIPTPTPTPTQTPIDSVLIGLIGGFGVGVVILLAIVYRRRG